jgi:ribose/xylose/arabinose/galactoside ABC-type transport system permease subunit
VSKGSGWYKTLLNKYGIEVAFVVVCAVIELVCPIFLTGINIIDIFRETSMTGIIAVGMTFIILAGDIDLTVGSYAALSGVLAAGLSVNNHFNTVLSLVIALLVCTVSGFICGIIITKAKVHSFVVTLGMQSLIRGSAMLYTNGLSISNLSKSLTYLGSGMIGVVPVPALLFIIILLIGYFVATKTSYGRYVYAIGGNREATRLSGINTDLVRICSFAVSGFLAGLAGLVLMGRVSSGQPTAASGWELNAIAAVVIGGTSMYGGRGSMFGTLIGALFLTVINNGLDIIGITPFIQEIVIGILIISVVVVDSVRKTD